jgi:hypothetical protein
MRLRAPDRAPAPSSSSAGVTALAVLLVVAGCALPSLNATATPVAGSGDSITETRAAGSFTAISVTGGVNVVISVGPATVVTVRAQPNLLPYVRTDIADGRLSAAILAPGVSSDRPVTLSVTVPTLASVSLDGGATATMQLESGVLAVSLSGGATLQAIGTVSDLALDAQGGAQARLGDLSAASATVTLGGGAQATIRAKGAVTGTADGGATLTLAAKPASLSVATTGGATVAGG